MHAYAWKLTPTRLWEPQRQHWGWEWIKLTLYLVGEKTTKQGRRHSKKPGAKASTWEFFVQMCWEEQKHPHASANFLGLSTKRWCLPGREHLKTRQRQAWLVMKEKWKPTFFQEVKRERFQEPNVLRSFLQPSFWVLPPNQRRTSSLRMVAKRPGQVKQPCCKWQVTGWKEGAELRKEIAAYRVNGNWWITREEGTVEAATARRGSTKKRGRTRRRRKRQMKITKVLVLIHFFPRV